MALQVERRSDGNPNTDEAVGDLSSGRRAMEETRLDEESGFDAGVVQNTDTRATPGSPMRHADVTRSGRTVGFNVENVTSSSRYRDGNPESEKDESLHFEFGHEP